MIRITLEKDAWLGWDGRTAPARVEVREFEDVGRADDWLNRKSYYAEPYTRKMTWERIP